MSTHPTTNIREDTTAVIFRPDLQAQEQALFFTQDTLAKRTDSATGSHSFGGYQWPEQHDGALGIVKDSAPGLSIY